MDGGPGETRLRFVVEAGDDDLPKAALEHARLAVLDWWGVTIGGAGEPVARILRENQRRPTTGLGGKFSVTHCAAAALLRGRLGETDFADAAVAESAVRALAARVAVTADPGLDETRARVRVRLTGGESNERVADLAAESDTAGMRRDLVAKFRDLVAPRLGDGATERLQGALEALDQLDDVRELSRLR